MATGGTVAWAREASLGELMAFRCACMAAASREYRI